MMKQMNICNNNLRTRRVHWLYITEGQQMVGWLKISTYSAIIRGQHWHSCKFKMEIASGGLLITAGHHLMDLRKRLTPVHFSSIWQDVHPSHASIIYGLSNAKNIRDQSLELENWDYYLNHLINLRHVCHVQIILATKSQWIARASTWSLTTSLSRMNMA